MTPSRFFSTWRVFLILLVGTLIALGSSAVAPFIYAMW